MIPQGQGQSPPQVTQLKRYKWWIECGHIDQNNCGGDRMFTRSKTTLKHLHLDNTSEQKDKQDIKHEQNPEEKIVVEEEKDKKVKDKIKEEDEKEVDEEEVDEEEVDEEEVDEEEVDEEEVDEEEVDEEEVD